MFKKILVGLDGSEGSWRAFRSALPLAKLASDSEVWAVSVEEKLPRMPELIDEFAEERDRENAIFETLQRDATKIAMEAGVSLKTQIIIGHAAQAIVRFAEDGHFDLLVVGSSGHSGVWGRFLGGTADKIVSHAPCDVFIVR